MRDLYVLQGAPGSGKSSLVAEEHLGPWTLSTDAMRREVSPGASAILDDDLVSMTDGRPRTSELVFDMLARMCRLRMSTGETIILDSTGARRATIAPFLSAARENSYVVTYVRFQDGLSLDDCLSRNAARRPRDIVPEKVVRRMYERVANYVCTDDERAVSPEGFLDGLWEPVVDGDAYDSVTFVGDVHNCYDKLVSTGVVDAVRDPGRLVVFVGDMLDRGPAGQAPDVLSLVREAVGREDCILVRGNHENHWFHADDVPAQTAASMAAIGGMDDEAWRRLATSFRPCVTIRRGGRLYFVSHAGVHPRRLVGAGIGPERIRTGLLSEEPLVYGDGREPFRSDYAIDIDGLIERESRLCPDVVQVHGHRNAHHHGIGDFAHVVNLESRVESGGPLSTYVV